MTKLGIWSAWVAVFAGALLFAFAAYERGIGAAMLVAFAVLLLLGAFRTLRKLSGGLRLLAGAWGVVIGLQAPLLFLLPAMLQPGVPAESGLPPFFLARFGLLLLALIGLGLAVLHKEK